MNNDLISQAKRMRDEMVAHASRRADEWLEGTLAALGQILPRADSSALGISKSQLSLGAPPIKFEQPALVNPDNSLIDNIRGAIRSLDQRAFTTLDIIAALRHVYDMDNPVKRSTISSTLKKLAVVHDELQILRKGRGSLPTKYRALRLAMIDGGEP